MCQRSSISSKPSPTPIYVTPDHIVARAVDTQLSDNLAVEVGFSTVASVGPGFAVNRVYTIIAVQDVVILPTSDDVVAVTTEDQVCVLVTDNLIVPIITTDGVANLRVS